MKLSGVALVCFALESAAQTPGRPTVNTSGKCSPIVINSGAGSAPVFITNSCNDADPKVLRELRETVARILSESPRSTAAVNALLARAASLEARLHDVEEGFRRYRDQIDHATLTVQDAQRWDLLEPGEQLFSNTIFRLPSGWQRQVAADGSLILTPQGSDFPRILIAKSEPFEGDFRALFEQRVNAVGRSNEGTESIVTNEGFPVLKANLTTVLSSQEVNLSMAAAHPLKRIELVTFVNFPGGFRIPTAQLFDRFLVSVDYVNSRAARPR